MPHLFCSLLQQLGFTPGTNAHHYLSSSISVLNHEIGRGRRCLWCHVCARVRADGTWLSPWLDLLPAKGQTWLQRIWQKEERKLVDPTHSLQPTTLVLLLDSGKTGTWEDSVSKCYAIFRLRAKMWITQLLSHKHRATACWLGSIQYLVTACKLFLCRSCLYSIPKLELNSEWRNSWYTGYKEILLFACEQLCWV